MSEIDLLGYKIEHKILDYSHIVQSRKVRKSLRDIVPISNTFDLLYRWSRDGSINSNKSKFVAAPLLVIYQTDNNKIFGGWTDIPMYYDSSYGGGNPYK